MKYRYYITDTMNGNVIGTNEESIARDFQTADDFFVVDALNGKWLSESGDDDIADAGGE